MAPKGLNLQIPGRPAPSQGAAAASGLVLGPTVALLVIDVQEDFIRGSLTVPGGEALLPLLNALAAAVAAAGGAVAATQDYHPPDHVSFVSSHPGHQLSDLVEVEAGGCSCPIKLFPRHCVAGSPGAEQAAGFERQHVQHVVRKGRQAGLEAFSAFYDMAHTGCTDLANWLLQRGTRVVLVCGVATEYCVRATVLDSLAEGFQTVLLTDAVAGVDEGASQEAISQMQQAGAVLMRAADVLESSRAAATTEAKSGSKAAAGGQAQQQQQPTVVGLGDDE